jgi:tRNA A-37 threonylcarbamoyl transferase component Bud32
LLIQDSYNFPSDISAIVFGLFIGFFLGFLLFFYLKIDFILCFTALGSALSFFVFSVFNLITHLEKLSIDSEYVNIECNNINYFDVFFKLSTSVVFSYLLGVFFVYKNLYISSILIAFTQPVLFFVVIIGVLFFTAYYLIKYKQQSDIGKILCHFLPYDFIKLNFKQTADNKKVDKPDPAKEQNDCKIETSLGCVVLYNQTVKKYIEKTDLTEPWAKSELEFHNLYESDNKELKEECIGGKTYFTFRQNRYSKEEGWFLLRDLEDQVSYFNSYLLIKSAFEQLNILYRLKIIHNDVKSDNLFFNIISKSVKLIDFGISVNMELSEQALPLTWPCKLNESDLTPAHREEINSAQSVQRRAYHHLRQNLNYDFQVFVKKISKIRKPDTKKILKEKSTKITSVAVNKPKIYFSWAILAFASLLNFLGCENVFILLAFFIVAGCSFSELKNFKITSQQDFISPQDFKAEQTPHVYFDDNQPSYEQAKYINSL